MRKLNSIILTTMLILTTLFGCGMPGPLYQEQKPVQESNATEQEKQNASNKQQE